MYRNKDCVNNAFFGQRAMGLAENGMRVQGSTILNPGFILFKLIQNSTDRDSELIKSPWWFQAPEIRNMLNDARYNSGGISTPSEQASQNAGISKTWTRAGTNYILAAKTFTPLRIYWGIPKPIGTINKGGDVSGMDSGQDISQIEIIPDPSCIQFYIPGMRKKAHMALSVLSRTKLDNNAHLATGDIESFIRQISKSA